MLQPRRVKHRKQHRGRREGHALTGNYIAFGDFGIQAEGAAWIDSRHIESARRAITREMKRGGQVWIRIFPDKPVTAKPAETRMGKGKGDIEFWAAEVKPGTILFELGNCTEEKAKLAFKRIAHKMPIKVRMVRRVATH